jgi:hypothetical protein
MTESCGGCRFYRDADRREQRSGHGLCRRYPEAMNTHDGKWCGEFVALSVEARDPEAVYRKLQRVLVQSSVASQEHSGGEPSDHQGDDIHPVEAIVDIMDQFSAMVVHAGTMGLKPTLWIVGSHVIDTVRFATGQPPAEEGSTDISELFGIPMEQSVDLSRGRVTLRCGLWHAGAFLHRHEAHSEDDR